MAIEFVKENIYASKCYDAQSIQLPIQEDVIVPDVKPDISKILQVDSKIIFDDIVVEVSRVKFVGKVDYNILYLAEGTDKYIHNISVYFTIDDFINVENISKDVFSRLNGYVENVRIELLNSRKLNINSIVEVEALFEEKYQKSIIVDAKGLDDIQIQKRVLTTRQLVINKDEKFIVKDEVAVPVGKANINEILWCDIGIKNKDMKVLDDKIAVKGDLNICILYAGEGDDRPLEFLEKDVPFNGIIDCRGATQEMYSDVDMRIAKHYIQIMPDLDGEERVMELEIVTEMNVKVYSLERKDIVDDIYSPSKKIIINREKTKFQNMIFKNQMKANVNENLTLSVEMPDIMQVFYVSAKPKIEEVQVLDNKVVAEGVVFTKIFYVAADDNNPLCSFEEVVPFQQIIEARDAKPENKVEIKSYVEYANCNMLSNREVEIRCSICFDTNVLEENEVNLIVNIEEKDRDMEELEKMPSVIIYVADKEDSLWKIAKKYNTTIDELTKINELEKAELSQGQKILIVKKVIDE